jgi:hypothetical protein
MDTYDKGTRTNSPAGGIKVLACRADADGQALNLWRQSRYSGERNVIKTVIHLIRQDDDFVLDADVPDFLQLLFGINLANRIV